MTLAQWIVAGVAAQRLAELLYARHNERRLRAEGAIEFGAGHYPLIVGLHAAWLAALFATAAEAAIAWPWMTAFGVLQVLRLWVLASLGRFWTTRVLSLPGAPLISAGPYRLCRHPNYLIVIGEIASLPLALGAWPLALAFSLANLPLLAWRIRVEEAALAERSAAGQG
jgi:methyltransferase